MTYNTVLKTLFVFTILFLTACEEPKETADLIIHNANITTVDKTNPTAEAIAIKDGKVLALGTSDAILAMAGTSTEKIDAQGQFVIPGLIEGHGHFSGLGYSLIKLNFMKTKSWEEVVAMVKEKAATAKPGEWIVGRGWHQEKWTSTPDRNVQGYPYHDDLTDVSPNNPVMLRHASGHSLFANKAAMDVATISKETPDPKGGHIIRDNLGEALGVFEERAMDIVYSAYQDYLDGLDQEALSEEWMAAIKAASAESIEKGITSFQDAGSSYDDVERYSKLAEEGNLDLRLWVMLRHPYEVMKDNLDGFPKIGLGNNFFTCRAIKSQVDGALGAYGAWLIEHYHDKDDFLGQNTTTVEEVTNVSKLCVASDMQLCVHAIGDRANHEVLNIFEKAYQSNPDKQDWRWRIEHSQHIATDDIPRFGQLGVLASMQAIHCTSDAPFVEKRLGKERSQKEAYPWRSLIDSGARINNGTDAPVEDVDPIESFYASVTRKRADNGLAFFPEQSMTRMEALESYTINNAYAAFEEDLKGSLEIGKLADITILSKDLLKCSDEEILETEVLYTIIDGEVKFQKK